MEFLREDRWGERWHTVRLYLRYWCMALALAVPIVIAGPSVAQGSNCSDVLANGTFQHLSVRGRDAWDMVNYRNFASSDANSNQTNASAEYVGYGYGSADYAEKSNEQHQVNSTIYNSTKGFSSKDILLVSGDQTIVGAWEQCMASKSGLDAYFTAEGSTDGHDVFLVIKWRQSDDQSTVDHVAFTTELALPPFAAIVGENCAGKGRVLRQGVACNLHIRLQRARDTLQVSVNTDHATKIALLPPRLTHVRTQPVPIQITSDNLSLAHAARYQGPTDINGSAHLNQNQIDQGWRIDPHGVNVTLSVDADNTNGKGYCAVEHGPDIHPFNVFYGYRFRNYNTAGTMACHVNINVNAIRDYWPALDEH